MGHDLPRALLLLLLPDRQPRVRGPRAAPVRRRGAADARRLAAHLRLPTPTTRASPRPTPRASCASASARPATSSSTPTSATAGASSRTSARSSRFLIDLKEQGLRVAGYGAPAKGNTLLNYCGVGPRLHRLHVRSEPAQAGPLPARQPHPDPLARGDPRGPARRRPDPAVEPQGRDHRAARLHPRVGRALRRAHAGADAALVSGPDAFVETPLPGAWVIELEQLGDERGWFARTFDAEEFRARGLNPDGRAVQRLVQRPRGTLRGMHYQAEPHGESKLVRCVRGAIFDVAVDLRPDSPTYRALARRRAERREPPRVLHPGRARARLPDARPTTARCSTRWAIPTCPRRRAACAGTTRRSGSSGPSRTASGSISEKDRAYAGVES